MSRELTGPDSNHHSKSGASDDDEVPYGSENGYHPFENYKYSANNWTKYM